jgi:hypothetical protein
MGDLAAEIQRIEDQISREQFGHAVPFTFVHDVTVE